MNAVTTEAKLIYCTLGAALNDYIAGQVSFAALESLLADAIKALPNEKYIFERIYHIINHYEIDVDLREDELFYAVAMKTKLQKIANSLRSGCICSVKQSLEKFWR